MLRRAAAKAAWVGRTASMVFGLALVLALLFGIASIALAGTGAGAPFNLGQINRVDRLSGLVGRVGNGASLLIDNNSASSRATALSLRVEPGRAPMRVNSSTRVNRLNADRLDGKSASQIGVNGLQRVAATSEDNSNSPKQQSVECPQGTVLVDSGYDMSGGKSGTFPNDGHSDLVVDVILPTLNSNGLPTGVLMEAYEISPTTAPWNITVYGVCARAP